MKGPKFLKKEGLDFLVTNISPGVFGFINFFEKKVWISYTENISEALFRNINLIETRQHKRIKKGLENWDVVVFIKTETKQSAKNHYRIICQEYKKKGLELLNKELSYRVWGVIEPHFKNPDEYLYYIWVGTKNKRMAVLGIFEKAKEGEEFLKRFKEKEALDLPYSSKKLMQEYKQFNKSKEDFNRMFKNG